MILFVILTDILTLGLKIHFNKWFPNEMRNDSDDMIVVIKLMQGVATGHPQEVLPCKVTEQLLSV